MKKITEYNEIEILQRLRKSDELAFEILFHRYKKRVKGFAHKMLPPYISSDKIVQEVFIKLWLNREKIDTSKKFSSFLFSVAKNTILDELKSAVNRKMVYAESNILEEAMPVQEFAETGEEDLDLKLQVALQKLPQRRRIIFNLSRFEGFTYKQIAAKLNISENTVDTQIRKSLHFLRQEFSNIL
ncbi:MAG: RNA polymerase sigma-70 factor [Prolixibacteraceae bacterium]|nr:RNA polymerase sigma-70 factor [Prolixibacteraceae bacterium]